MPSIYYIIQTVLLALVISLTLGWLSKIAAQRIQLIDWPNSAEHKIHKSPTPLAGGIAFFSALLICSLWFGIFFDNTLRIILLTASIIFVFGLIDDYRSIPARYKLIGQFGAAILLYYLGISVKFFESPEFVVQLPQPWPMVLNFVITLVWLIGISNAFNFVDSMDGLAVGVAGMAATFFCLLALISGQWALATLFAAILGISVGLYLYNAPPALFFLGDSGSQTLGFILAALAIVYQPVGANQSSSWFAPIMLLGIPIFDTLLVVVSRIRRGIPVYRSAVDHTYHRLLLLGLQPNRAVLVMQITSFILGLLALLCLYLPPLQANIIFLIAMSVGLLWIVWLDRRIFWR